MFMFMLGLALFAIMVHLLLMKPQSNAGVVEAVLLYLLVIIFGFGTLLAGLMHIFNGPATAQMIGWPAGSPFQFEVGVADISLGLVCILAPFFRGSYWLAAILANSFFLFGAFIGHVHDYLTAGNAAAYNIGPDIFFSDLIVPLVMIGLYFVYRRLAGMGQNLKNKLIK